MGGKGGGGNDQMVQLQMQQAEEARQKETARQGRLTQGLAGIKDAFEGKPVMKDIAKKFDWSTFKAPTQPNVNLGTMMTGSAFKQPDTAVAGLPAGYKYVQIPGAPAPTAVPTGGGGGGGGGSAASGGYVGGHGAVQPGAAGGATTWRDTQGSGGLGGGGHDYGPATNIPIAGSGGAGSGGTAATWGIVGPDGKIYRQGEDITYTGQQDTGKRTGGFNDQYFKDYGQKFQNIYMPQVAKQYGKALENTTYDLARAGTGISSAATDVQADLSGQNIENRANVVSEADKAAADLKSRVGAERAKAEGQLYATENPDVATNQAIAAVRNISLDQPKQSTLGDVFKLALIGGANALQGYQTQRTLNQIPGYNAPGTKIV